MHAGILAVIRGSACVEEFIGARLQRGLRIIFMRPFGK